MLNTDFNIALKSSRYMSMGYVLVFNYMFNFALKNAMGSIMKYCLIFC